MSLSVGVQGGTGAGIRPPFEGAPCAWACRCLVRDLPTYAANALRVNPGYLAACPDCGERRPS